MIEVCDYAQGDIFDLIDIKEIYSHDRGALERVEELRLQPKVTIKTIKSDLGIIAVVGGTLNWPGVMEIWSVTGNEVYKHPLSYFKTCIRLLSDYQKTFGIHRFQASCLYGKEDLEKWFSKLGFLKEATMRKYGPNGEDFYLFARVF